ncbi:MAG: hypothetical protein FWF29_00340 [Treponema sp.]|nr:hypothetical protein [Treponema sp.]
MYIEILIFIIIGIILLWFGFSLFIGQLTGIHRHWQKWQKTKRARQQHGEPGDPQVCPVCSTKLGKGYLVKSQAFPSLNGGQDRLMYIRGCIYCINGDLPRVCPVCGMALTQNDFLIARMFERPDLPGGAHQKNHVHVNGCSRCKRLGGLMD